MTDTKIEPTDTVPELIDLNEPDKEHVARGAALYVKHLEEYAAEAQGLGRQAEAVKAGADAAWLRGDLVTPILGDEDTEPTGKLSIQYRHMPAIHNGLGRLVKNMKAARGTLRPLGYERVIEKLTERAAYVEGQLIPRFAEQTELLAEPPKPGSGPMLVPDDEPAAVALSDFVSQLGEPAPPPASEVSGLRTAAEAMAE